MLEGCRARDSVAHLVYASSSSVYGANHTLPFSEDQPVDHPVSLYAATKAANELMAHSYSHLYRLPTTGLRFFTVYGPWGRPDMAPMLFTRAILAGEPIQVFNHGRMRRDFTYVDDIVEGVVRVLARPPAALGDGAPYVDLQHRQPRSRRARRRSSRRSSACWAGRRCRELLPMQPGDVRRLTRRSTRCAQATGFAPSTPLADGLARFVEWYREYYGVAGG